MWYVEDYEHIYSDYHFKTFENVAKVLFRNTEYDECHELNFITCIDTYYLDGHKIYSVKFDCKKAMKVIKRSRRTVLGVAKNRFYKITEDDLELITVIEKPKICIKKNLPGHAVPDVYACSYVYSTGTILELIIREKQRKSQYGSHLQCYFHLVYIDDKYVYVCLANYFTDKFYFPCGLMMYHRYRILDNRKFNKIVTKRVLMG